MNVNVSRNDDIATTFYTMNFRPGVFEYRGMPISNGGDFRNEVTLVCAAKTDLYFAERRAKRADTILAVVIGVLIAVVSASATAYFTALFK